MRSNVARALGFTPRPGQAETATCAVCGGELQHDAGRFGETIERCVNPECFHHRWHAPMREVYR